MIPSNFEKLSHHSKEYLNCKSRKELNTFFIFCKDTHFYAARDYLRGCAFSELPKFINHPSESVKVILRERLVKGR